MANCLNCGKIVKNKFCNVSCQDAYYARLKRERYYTAPNTCYCCGKELDWGHRKNKYCSSSCAAKINNVGIRRNYKKQLSNIEKILDDNFIAIVNSNSTLTDIAKALGYKRINNNIRKKILKRCKKLNIKPNIKQTKSIKNYTKAEIFNNYKNWQSARSNIRKDAERTFKNSNKKLECYLCGYNNHIEIAHIKAVSNFPENTLISEINNLYNLIPLCPNHHWEFDHNKLSEENLDKIKKYSAMDQ